LGVNEVVEINSNNTENLQEALNHANFDNIRATVHVNIDMDVATEADLNRINQFIEAHQQAEEQDQELESEEKESPITESSVKTYSDALKQCFSAFFSRVPLSQTKRLRVPLDMLMTCRFYFSSVTLYKVNINCVTF
jgi:transcriptional regulator of heat shock response